MNGVSLPKGGFYKFRYLFLTVPTTLPIRTASQGRSFAPPMETLESSISPVVEYSSLPLVGNL